MSRATLGFGLLRTAPVLTLEFLCPGQPFGPGQTGHPSRTNLTQEGELSRETKWVCFWKLEEEVH